jgi:hypothetical protein
MTVATLLYFFNKYRVKAVAPEFDALPLDAIIAAERCIANDKASGIRSAATRMFSYLHQMEYIRQDLITFLITQKSITKMTNRNIKNNNS